MTKTHGIIVAAVAHEKNLYDAHALPEILDQAEALTDIRAKRAIVDRGYRGRQFVDGTETTASICGSSRALKVSKAINN